MRTHIVTKLICSECENLLELSDSPPSNRYSNGEPSGAFTHNSIVGVRPCYTCMGPARIAKKAIQDLMGLK